MFTQQLTQYTKLSFHLNTKKRGELIHIVLLTKKGSDGMRIREILNIIGSICSIAGFLFAILIWLFNVC